MSAHRPAHGDAPDRGPRPLHAHLELTEQLIGHLGATVVRAFLEGDERGISAGLVLERGGAELLMPCHPADAVALAVRARAPIVAEDNALAHA